MKRLFIIAAMILAISCADNAKSKTFPIGDIAVFLIDRTHSVHEWKYHKESDTVYIRRCVWPGYTDVLYWVVDENILMHVDNLENQLFPPFVPPGATIIVDTADGVLYFEQTRSNIDKLEVLREYATNDTLVSMDDVPHSLRLNQ